MNFSLTADHEIVRDSMRDYFADHYPFSRHLDRIRHRRGVDAELWAGMAGLGWLGLMVPTEAGGVGAGQEEAMLLMQEAGAALNAEPLLATVVLSAPLLAQSLSSTLIAEALEATLAGRASLALAWSESSHGFDPLDIQTTAVRTGESGFLLNGAKVLVDNGGSADWIIVPARVGAGDEPLDGISLFLVPGDAKGLTRKPVPMIDGSWAADLVLEDVQLGGLHLIGDVDQGGSALLAAVYRGLAANCAEALGAVSRSIEICKAYLQERQQFGKPLGAFQALQHRYADMVIAKERARSMSLVATIRANEQVLDDYDAIRDFSLAKQVVGQAARMVGGHAVQLHGGMGMALEYPIGHYYRKLLHCDAGFGTPDDHLSILVETDVRIKQDDAMRV